jgi:hypothetical protein
VNGKRTTATDVRPRMLLLARRLYEGVTLTVRWITTETGVSEPQAREDMANLRMYLPCEQFKVGRAKAVRLARRIPRAAT